MTTALYIVTPLLGILFIWSIYIFTKQFLAIRKEEKLFDSIHKRASDCVGFSYIAKSHSEHIVKSEIYIAKKSGFIPVIPMQKKESKVFGATGTYNSISTY